MNQIAGVSQTAIDRVSQIAGHLLHPRAVRLRVNPGDGHAAGLQRDHEEDKIPPEPCQCQHLDREQIAGRQAVPVRLQERLPRRASAPFGSRVDPVVAQDHRPASTAAGAAVVFLGDQPPVPAKDRVRGDDARDLPQDGTVKFAMSAVTTMDEAGAIQPRSVHQRRASDCRSLRALMRQEETLSPLMSNSRFATFLSTFDPQAHRRGQQWEEVCQWFLQTDPVYRALLTKVWLWNEWPGRWGPDAGIDLVAKAKNGELWAIQAKNYAPDRRVTKHDVDTFLSESARPAFSYRLLIATTSRLAPAADRAMTGQEKRADTLLRHVLERRDGLKWPTSFSAWKQGRVPRHRPKRPRPHQKKALRAATTQLARHDRGQLVLACGTGKTLVAPWLRERLEAKRTLVLVPSLSLLKQTMQEWVANWSQPFEVLPVCSDDTVRPNDRDAVVSSVTELGFPRDHRKGRGSRVPQAPWPSGRVLHLPVVPGRRAGAQGHPTWL